MDTVEQCDIAIVGAGPAGLMAAITAAERGRRVIVLEQLPKPGRKLLATGGGRCNLACMLPVDQIAARFGRHGRFMMPALNAINARGLRAFFDGLGVPTHMPDNLHVYPTSNSASTVLRALEGRAERLGVIVRTGVRVSGLWLEGEGAAATGAAGKGASLRVRGVDTDGGRVEAAQVLVATGGRGYPELGATGTGYDLARQAGHTIVDPTPAIVPLLTAETCFRECAGVSLPAVRIWIDLPKQSKQGATGDLLFTHRGISGPAVLDLSGDVAELLATRPSVPVRIDTAPDMLAETWLQRFDEWQARGGAKTVRMLLAQHMPKSVAAVLSGLAGIDPIVRPSQVSRPARQAMAAILKGLPLTITGTEGWDAAMVTRGGVALKEVDPHMLQSRLVPGLFFAGEVLDLDGPCGGFNLQWAFSSGRLAGHGSTECGERSAE
jgi:predicted Rossmann fold flavoprotein